MATGSVRVLRRAAIAALLLFVAFGGLSATATGLAVADEVSATGRTTVTIASKGTNHTFDVELATSEETRSRGLMFRTSMGADQGMLFLYREPRPIAMWMKNTFIPLDIVFFSTDGAILNVQANAEPHSLVSRPSLGDAIGALEINGGRAAELGIAAGDTILLPKVDGVEP